MILETPATAREAEASWAKAPANLEPDVRASFEQQLQHVL
jgi:hypothetical protein